MLLLLWYMYFLRLSWCNEYMRTDFKQRVSSCIIAHVLICSWVCPYAMNTWGQIFSSVCPNVFLHMSSFVNECVLRHKQRVSLQYLTCVLTVVVHMSLLLITLVLIRVYKCPCAVLLYVLMQLLASPYPLITYVLIYNVVRPDCKRRMSLRKNEYVLTFFNISPYI